MTRIRSIVVVAALLVAAVSVAPGTAVGGHDGGVDCSFPISVTDATGSEVTVEEEPQRVVVLAPSAAQTVWAIGAEEKVVGMPVNQYTSYLNGTESRTNVVGERGQPVAEAVVGTEPDLVLAPNVISDDAIANLRDAGLTVYKYELANSLADVTNKTRLTGRLVGSFGSAAQVSATTEAKVQAVRDAVSSQDRPTVFYPLGGGFTAGPGSFVGDILDTAGGDNVAVRANISTYARISQEVLAANTIDWIVTTGDSPLPKNTAINNSRAVAEGQVVRVNANYLNQPAPRVVRPLGEIATALHPQAMDDVDLDGVTGEPSVSCAGATDSMTTTDGMGTTTTDSSGETTATMNATTAAGESTTAAGDGATTTVSDDGPGFTLVAALVGLLGAALVALRRDQ